MQESISNLSERLRLISNMIHTGERIAWGSDSCIMDEAAQALDDYVKIVDKLTKELGNQNEKEIFKNNYGVSINE